MSVASTRWMRDAACVPGLPWTTDTADVERLPVVLVDLMRATCEGCPVRAACEDYVSREEISGGWWAGADRDPEAVWALVEWVPVTGPGGRLVGEQAILPLDHWLHGRGRRGGCGGL
jgi:hypothetical protein